MSRRGRRYRRDARGCLVSEHRDLKRDARALYREECGHDPSPRQLRRWVKEKNRELPRTDVLKSGGRVA